jgi:hypothetical protein
VAYGHQTFKNSFCIWTPGIHLQSRVLLFKVETIVPHDGGPDSDDSIERGKEQKVIM